MNLEQIKLKKVEINIRAIPTIKSAHIELSGSIFNKDNISSLQLMYVTYRINDIMTITRTLI